MILNMYAVFDAAVHSYAQPFYLAESSTHDEARRVFSVAASDKASKLYQSPHDFMLVYVGQFDDQRGLVESCNPPLRIMSCIEALALYRDQRAQLVLQFRAEQPFSESP